jgi:uncharacterized membrane protein YhaH (DUF805 family)
VVFCLVPGVLGQFAKFAGMAGEAGTVLHTILVLASLALTIWGFVEIGCLRGSAGANTYGPDPLADGRRMRSAAAHHWRLKSKEARWP